MTGMITEIQRFSLNDGDGIRTTVFFKGCNLRCAWCHNPETFDINPTLLRYPEKCIGCGHCDDCPTGARTISGREVSVEDIMREVRQDAAYYKNSDGGVTFSGGEVMCQAEFAREVALACKSEGIRVGVETNLSLDWEKMSELIDLCDLVMCDLKIADSELHKLWTKVGNEKILENLGKLAKSGRRWILRTPLIPGATDSDENIASIAKTAAKLKPDSWELLNFNPLGGAKYKALGLKNRFEGAEPLGKPRLEELKTIAEGSGRKVIIA